MICDLSDDSHKNLFKMSANLELTLFNFNYLASFSMNYAFGFGWLSPFPQVSILVFAWSTFFKIYIMKFMKTYRLLFLSLCVDAYRKERWYDCRGWQRKREGRGIGRKMEKKREHDCIIYTKQKPKIA